MATVNQVTSDSIKTGKPAPLMRTVMWAATALALLFFFQMYQARPVVIFSPGGLATKIAQMLLEVCLIYLIIADWRKSRHSKEAS